jgi:nucleotide-binding universal stress UspA family protein
MSIFHRILFAGDLSDRSRAAFGAACSLAGESGGHLHVLHVVESAPMAGPPDLAHGSGDVPPQTPSRRQEIEDELHAFYRAAPALAVDYLVRGGSAPNAILRTADEVEADLIVVGTHGRTGLDRLLNGSVAESVLQRSTRPVLVVRQTDRCRTEKPIRTVLHPTDFSEGSRRARGVAWALARSHRARLVLLHAGPADVGPERAELAHLKEQADQAGLDVSVDTRFGQGEPVTEIITAARDLGCDLIVLGTHARTGFDRLMVGNVAESVIREAPCLTLVVKGAPVEPPKAKPEPKAAAGS